MAMVKKDLAKILLSLIFILIISVNWRLLKFHRPNSKWWQFVAGRLLAFEVCHLLCLKLLRLGQFPCIEPHSELMLAAVPYNSVLSKWERWIHGPFLAKPQAKVSLNMYGTGEVPGLYFLTTDTQSHECRYVYGSANNKVWVVPVLWAILYHKNGHGILEG